MKTSLSPVNGLIIILGSPNKPDGTLYSIAQERCALALQIYRKNPTFKLLLTGGYGDHFNTSELSHAFYLKKYLMTLNIPPRAIVEFAESGNTLEDATLTRPIVEKYQPGKIIVITSDYHLARAKYIFEREFQELKIPIEFAAATTNKENCEVDLDALIRYEVDALTQLQQEDGAGAK